MPQAPQPNTPAATAAQQIDAGHFTAAEATIKTALAAPHLDSAQQQTLRFQRERMRRILLDFTLDADAAKAKLRKQIPDLSDAEFATWDAAGLLEKQVIDGRTLYFSRAPSNLFRLSAEARARRAHPVPFNDGPNEVLNDHHRAIRAAALRTGSTSVLPMREEVTQTLTVHADAVPAGETIRAWLPFPREIKGQAEGVTLVAHAPAAFATQPSDAVQRTVYLEAKAVAGKPTTFSVTWQATLYGRDFHIDPSKVVRAPITPDLQPYVAERAPHIVFTEAMRAYSKQVVGGETNPYRIAQKLFDAVDTIPWAGAREYSTLSNIGDYTLHAGHGDCGEQTLLLLTLLRLNGIPARWQSGWMFSDGTYNNIHDWGQVYLAPYGWVPVDVTSGRLHGDPSLEHFYLGGLDAYRVAFNDDYARPFQPAKTFPRSETVDSQRGEAEWRGGNLYFDQWDYDFRWHRVDAPGGGAPTRP
ncbi:transglutaminase-like domain-containing protein [Luteibacter yeojuensis]|uniref:Transglutaminase n=1 Tax=Luteibacter yeojuensis TaxID=345309 RepID=A0A0F3KDL7_9GAMM|nr:transglutaminase-like domain-containing protein [Luteibacter yeojuensis]KJV29082.1 transglutaminase [Luteibacter yeojuensis]